MRPAIEATALGKRYGRTWALRDCCLRIPTARITALIGPNGAGKTTLLNLAIGILAPDRGGIETFGWSPRRQPALVLGRVGYVPQDRPLYARFTVADTLHIGRALNPKWTSMERTSRSESATSHSTVPSGCCQAVSVPR